MPKHNLVISLFVSKILLAFSLLEKNWIKFGKLLKQLNAASRDVFFKYVLIKYCLAICIASLEVGLSSGLFLSIFKIKSFISLE